MPGLSKVMLVVAVLFTLGNLGGAGVAAAWGEPLHAGIHVVLLLLGAYFVRRLAPKRYAGRSWRPGGAETPAITPEIAERLTHLERSVDTVAIEVERIGEGQRFMTRVFTANGTPENGTPEDGPSPAPTEGVPKPVATGADETRLRAHRS